MLNPVSFQAKPSVKTKRPEFQGTAKLTAPRFEGNPVIKGAALGGLVGLLITLGGAILGLPNRGNGDDILMATTTLVGGMSGLATNNEKKNKKDDKPAEDKPA